MNIQDALSFLQRHQTLPKQPSAAFVDRFDNVLHFISKNPDEKYIPFLIRCFGNWPDPYFYEKLQVALRRFPQELVRPHLKKGLKSRCDSVRSWCADTARYFPHEDFIPILGKMLREKNVLVRYASAAGLEKICSPKVRLMAEMALPGEVDRDVRNLLKGILKSCLCA